MTESSPDGQINALGGPAASRAGQFSWAMFDWANQPYFTIVTTAIFAPYFVNGFIGDAVRGQSIYSFTLMFAGVAVALLGPILGAIADAGGRRKPWIFWLAAVFFFCALGLWSALPGAPNGILGPIVFVIGASIAMETMLVFYNAMLPEIAPAARMGRLSGQAWGLGYFGGIVALLLMQWLLVLPGVVSLPGVPEAPIFGVDQSLFEPERLTGPIAAFWFAVFVAPFFFFTPDRARTDKPMGAIVRQGLRDLAKTISHVRQFGNVMLFLLGRMIYYDGLNAVFAFGGIYAATVLGWRSVELGLLGLIMLVFAGLGSFFGGWFDDRFGSKRTIVSAVSVLVVGVLGLASVGPDTVLFFFKTASVSEVDGLFASLPEQVYMFFAVVMGLGMGPAQAASRTMMARLAPKDMVTEFFGLYALSGKATAFLAPLLIGIATVMLQNTRASLIVILTMLVVGLLIILPVKEERAGEA